MKSLQSFRATEPALLRRASPSFEKPLTPASANARSRFPAVLRKGSAAAPRTRHKWGPTGIAGGSSCAPVRLSYQPRPGRRMYGLTSAFLLPAARKRASGVWDAQMISVFILGQLMPDVLSYLCLILTYRVDIVTTAPELPITIFELQLTELLIYHQAALSFQISDKRRYTHLGRYL